MSKKVYKYGTGDVIPENAVYLHTWIQEFDALPTLVWHYFLVEVEDE